MPDPSTAANLPSSPHRGRSIPAGRAARQAKTEREQCILRDLCAGVPDAEITAREGLTRRRMQAVVEEALARLTPAPPAERLELQIALLNEAMRVACSAVARGNLKAVDLVVKITRKLDRCHRLAAAATGPGKERPGADVGA